MIIPALSEYYLRKSADPATALAPEGFEFKEIPFLIVIDKDGRFVQIQDTREGEGKTRRAKPFLVPKGVKKTSGVASSLLWDSAEYVLGIATGEGTDKKPKSPARIAEQHATFKNEIVQAFGVSPSVPALHALLTFLQAMPIEEMHKDPLWPEIVTSNPFITFRMLDDAAYAISEREDVRKAIECLGSKAADGICGISGEPDVMERLHPALKGVRGAQSSGANIVSFNRDAFNSYGKEQGANAPMGKRTVFAYTTALNHLLGKDSRQKVQLGDATTVFWAEKNTGGAMEDLFGELVAGTDNPDQGTDRLRALYALEAHQSLTDDDTQKFFVLGLSPNAARISIRFWHVATIRELGERILQHFKDLEIAQPSFETRSHISLWRLLASTALQNKLDNVPPQLAGTLLQSILNGSPYPPALLQACIRRIRAELGQVTPVRAALLKACLNRNSRYQSSNHKEEITVSLDTSNDNTGYRLGRLFAALERVQERAQGNLNASIRERYYGAASSTPATVLPLLMKLKNHHLAKLDNRGEAVNLEKLLGEIMDGIDTVPAHLPLPDQARFALGYYHQHQAFFDKT